MEKKSASFSEAKIQTKVGENKNQIRKELGKDTRNILLKESQIKKLASYLISSSKYFKG